MPLVRDVTPDDLGKVVATFNQGTDLAVKEGDAAEVIFPMYPGLVFTVHVVDTIDIAVLVLASVVPLLPVMLLESPMGQLGGCAR